jgi:hypothetical protein
MGPDLPGPLVILSRIAGAEGRRQEALAAARRAAVLAPQNRTVRATLAREYLAVGEASAARAILADLEGEVEEPCVQCIVDVHLAMGNLDAAVARVERGGYMPGPSHFPKADPAYDAFRDDPRFRRILEAARLD